MNRGQCLVVGIIGALLVFAWTSGETSAQEAAQESTVAETETIPFGDWLLRCVERNNALPCDILQSVIDQKTQKQVLQFSVAHNPSTGQNALQLILPLGVMLKNGISLKIDDHQIDGIRIKRCEKNGCYVEAMIEPEVMERFATGGEASVLTYDPAEQPIALPFSLSGFAEAHAALIERLVR